MRLDGKTIFVTGGSSGIGRAVVARAHALGARAYFTYLSGEARARDVELAYPGARALHCDLRSASEIAAAIELTRSETGRLDGLVHSAGIYREASLDSDGFAATLDEVMQINFTAAVHAIRAAVPAMRAQWSSSIVTISSIESAQTAKADSLPYSISKWALDALAVGAAMELSDTGIRVNAVAPGPILTEMWEGTDEAYMERFRARVPLGRFGTAEEVASLVAYLLSDESAYITGQIINVDGGLLRRTM